MGICGLVGIDDCMEEFQLPEPEAYLCTFLHSAHRDASITMAPLSMNHRIEHVFPISNTINGITQSIDERNMWCVKTPKYGCIVLDFKLPEPKQMKVSDP